MMKTTGLLVVFTLFVILYQTSAVPVASSYKLDNENVMDVMEAKEKSEEASDDEKAKEDDEEADKEDEKSDEEKKEDDVKNEDEEEKEDEEKKDDEDKKDDEENKEDEDNKEDKEEKEEDKEEEPDLNEQENDQESSGEENVDLDSDHLVLQGSGNGKIKGVVIEDSDKEKDKPEKRSVDDDKKPSKSTQAKRCGCGCGDAFDSGGCDYMGGGCGGAPGGVYGPTCGCGGCGTCGTNDWCAPGTMCSNCKGGFGPPISCAGCNNGCCPSLTFPCAFGATVNNPGCECCKEKTPPGKCKWPCMWPCCCTCTPPKFEFKPLKPEPVCHCPSPHSHHTTCGHHCLRSSTKRGPVKRSLMEEQPSAYMPAPYNYGYAPFYNPFYNGMPMMPYPRLF